MPTFSQCLSESNQLGERNYCTVKAISIAGNHLYMKVHSACANYGRKRRHGCVPRIWERAMESLGLTWTESRPTKPNGGSYTMKTIGRVFPKGRHIVQVRGHVAALVDGQAEDWTEGRQHRVVRVLSLTPHSEVKPKSKNLNPQPVIDAKRAAVEKAGGLLVYRARRWYIIGGSVDVVLTSQQFSDHSIEGLVRYVCS